MTGMLYKLGVRLKGNEYKYTFNGVKCNFWTQYSENYIIQISQAETLHTSDEKESDTPKRDNKIYIIYNLRIFLCETRSDVGIMNLNEKVENRNGNDGQ